MIKRERHGMIEKNKLDHEKNYRNIFSLAEETIKRASYGKDNEEKAFILALGLSTIMARIKKFQVKTRAEEENKNF